MGFEVFERETVGPQPPRTAWPLVAVNERGLISFNPAGWRLLAGHCGTRWPEVTLAFDAATRTAAVQPEGARLLPAGSRWTVRAMRSADWPMAVAAPQFVVHYQIGVGEYPATLVTTEEQVMVTFDVGPAEPRPNRIGTVRR